MKRPFADRLDGMTGLLVALMAALILVTPRPAAARGDPERYEPGTTLDEEAAAGEISGDEGDYDPIADRPNGAEEYYRQQVYDDRQPYGAEAGEGDHQGYDLTEYEPAPPVEAPRDAYGGLYDGLAPYGEFLSEPRVGGGWVWRPHAHLVGAGFRPFAVGGHGRFEYTNYGFMYVTDFPWGPLVFQHGNWLLHRRHGWVWTGGADLRWAPARVTWRHGGGYVGWAPEPPPGWSQTPASWVYAPEARFGVGPVAEMLLPPAAWAGLYASTALLRPHRTWRHWWHPGPRPRMLKRRIRRIHRLRLPEGRGRLMTVRLRGGDIAYRRYRRPERALYSRTAVRRGRRRVESRAPAGARRTRRAVDRDGRSLRRQTVRHRGAARQGRSTVVQSRRGERYRRRVAPQRRHRVRPPSGQVRDRHDRGRKIRGHTAGSRQLRSRRIRSHHRAGRSHHRTDRGRGGRHQESRGGRGTVTGGGKKGKGGGGARGGGGRRRRRR